MTYCADGQLDQLVLLQLTPIAYGHNNTYIYLAEEQHDERPQDQSETAGTQTHRHPEPARDYRNRHFVSRESVLRLQRPPASSLRDAAAPPSGRQFHSRCGHGLWSLSANLLSSANCIRP